MPEHKKLRVAVIGCGMIHVEHMQGYAELKDKVEIVCRSRPEARMPGGGAR